MLIPGMPRARASSVYKEVEVALACQPGEAEPAINGDGHGTVKNTFFVGKVPPAWLRQIESRLVHVHKSAEGIEVRRAVSMDSFHAWVACKVRAADNQYVPGNTFIGRSRNVREIHQSLSTWAISQSIDGGRCEHR